MFDRNFIISMLAFMPLSGAAAAAPDFAAAVAAPGRPAEAVQMDEGRRPAAVLQWLGLERGDRVLDYFTGTGYYAEIMARAVGPEGLVVGWNSAVLAGHERIRPAIDGVRQRNSNTAFYSGPVTALSFPAESFDFVMLHLVYHDAYWESAQFGVPRIDPNSVAQAMFGATKPGGTLAVVDHVANPGRETRAEVQATHRMDPAVIRADFERAGFVFDGESDLLRNPQDNRTVNVYDAAIRGRTDRVIYRFRRPAR